MLYLNGYGLEIDDLKAFRQLGSKTPGHPEVGHTEGVEVTTGPLGQGFANAVGMAIAERNLRARFGSDVCDHHTFVIAGDGCLMEGISHEAASLAGHLGLDRLICIFDDNRITIDGSTNLSCSDDVAMRFKSYGWNVVLAGEIGEDLDALEQMLLAARSNTGSPTICILRTHIGFPSPDLTDSHEAHGNPFTAELVSRTKNVMNIPDEPFWAPQDVVDSLREHALTRGEELVATYSSVASVASHKKAFDECWSGVNEQVLTSLLPSFDESTNFATRQAIQKVIEATLPSVPGLIIGSADLTGNTGVKVSGQTAQSATTPEGRQVYFGIREHAMGAALVGMALHGGVMPVGGTFFVFADYMKPAIRLAALSRAKCIFVFSHDSVGVGEDGPTHQPIEQLASLRSIPGLQVIRPADSNETAEAWFAALTYEGPTALILSRQNLPLLSDGRAVKTGAAEILRLGDAPLVTLLATGSEVSLCVQSAKKLFEAGVSSRVVSFPSWERFNEQSTSFKQTVLGDGVAISVEAASTFGWAQYASTQIGIDRFGTSAPGSVALKELGMSVENVIKVVQQALASLSR
jgi:transketolase